MLAHTACFLLDDLDIFLVHFKVHGDGGRFDGDTALLFVFTGVCETHVSGLCWCNDTSLGDEGVGESRFSVIDWGSDKMAIWSDRGATLTMGDDTHVTNVGGPVHEGSDLVCIG